MQVSTNDQDGDPDLREGIDPGDPLTKKGRVKKRKADDDETADPNDPDRYKQKAYHIRRSFSLYGHLPSIINNGIKRRAKLAAGENAAGIQSDYDYETFLAIVDHLEGFDDDIKRLKHHPKVFRKLVRSIREAADQARNNDTANLKKDIACMLTDDGDSVLKAMRKGIKASSKNDRGFENEIMGKYLCPVSMDWDDLRYWYMDVAIISNPLGLSVREDIREGRLAVTAGDWPRLLYTNLDCDLDDIEIGLGRNLALVRVVKYLFTGRSSAFSDTPGGKTTRAGNAQLAGMTEITPKTVAYGACMYYCSQLRFAISNEESWTKLDKEFNYEEFYWYIVGIFEDSGEFGKELLAWWNLQVFGTSEKTSLAEPAVTSGPTCLSLLREQRALKRARMDTADKENEPPPPPPPSHIALMVPAHPGPHSQPQTSYAAQSLSSQPDWHPSPSQASQTHTLLSNLPLSSASLMPFTDFPSSNPHSISLHAASSSQGDHALFTAPSSSQPACAAVRPSSLEFFADIATSRT